MTQSLNELSVVVIVAVVVVVVVVVVAVVVAVVVVVVSEKVSTFGKQNYDLKRENMV